MEPEFMSDALDDLRDFYAIKPPTVFDVPRGFVPCMIVAREMLAADPEFLQIVDPVSFLILGTAMAARAQYHATVYTASQEQSRGVRKNLYALDVAEPHKRLTRAEKVAAEDRVWGLHS
jgi:hypothetical protein